jgi:hypothetical protein
MEVRKEQRGREEGGREEGREEEEEVMVEEGKGGGRTRRME